MLLIAFALATMPVPLGRPVPTDPTNIGAFTAETRGMDLRASLHLDTAGQPVACTVDPPATPRLAKQVCAYLTARARYAPARDASGSPVPAVVRLDLSMNRGGVAPAPLDFALQVGAMPGAATMAVADLILTTDAGGRVTACDVARSSGSAALDRLGCRQLQAATLSPGLDRQQQPVAAVRQVSVGFTAAPVPR